MLRITLVKRLNQFKQKIEEKYMKKNKKNQMNKFKGQLVKIN